MAKRERTYLYLVAKRRETPAIPGYEITHDRGVVEHDLEHGYAWVIRHYDPVTGVAVYDLVMYKPLARYVAIDVTEEEVRSWYNHHIGRARSSITKKYGYVSDDAIAERLLKNIVFRDHPELRYWVDRGW